MAMMHPHVSFLGREVNMKEMKLKVKPMKNGKLKHFNPLTILWHNVIWE